MLTSPKRRHRALTTTVTAHPTEPQVILSVQQARLVTTPIEGSARWELAMAGAGPAALGAARRDLTLLTQLPAGHRLRVMGFSETSEGGIAVEVPWFPEDEGLDRVLHDRGPLPLPRVLALARGLSASLAILHQQGLVHGGLHPRLVRVPSSPGAVGPAGDPYLVGAGWAALRAAWIQRGEPDPGVIRYLAPEMLRGQASKLDRQADLFGLGCLIFESITGHPVFGHPDAESVRQAVIRPERPDLRQALGPAEEPLARVLRRCLAAEPADRYPSATALWRELAPALGGQATPLPVLHDPGGRSGHATLGAAGGPGGAVGAAPDAPTGPGAAVPSPLPSLGRGRRALRSNPVFVTATVFVVAAAIALGVVAWQRASQPTEPPADPIAEELFSGGSAPASRRIGEDARRTSPDASPDPLHTVPSPVPVDPRTSRLREALGRVGFTEEEALVSELLRRHVARAVRALGARDYRLFDEAMKPVELATRARECPGLLVQKRSYVIGGLRSLGTRLGRWERFRIERMLADADAIPGACPTRSALLRPLVLEIRDRLRRERALGR